jgi:hypothetical protein
MLDLISNLFFPSKYGDFGPFFHPKKKNKKQKPTSYDLQPQVAEIKENTGFDQVFFSPFLSTKKR